MPRLRAYSLRVGDFNSLRRGRASVNGDGIPPGPPLSFIYFLFYILIFLWKKENWQTGGGEAQSPSRLHSQIQNNPIKILIRTRISDRRALELRTPSRNLGIRSLFLPLSYPKWSSPAAPPPAATASIASTTLRPSAASFSSRSCNSSSSSRNRFNGWRRPGSRQRRRRRRRRNRTTRRRSPRCRRRPPRLHRRGRRRRPGTWNGSSSLPPRTCPLSTSPRFETGFVSRKMLPFCLFCFFFFVL